MRTWRKGWICQSGPTCYVGNPPEYCIPEKYRCSLKEVWAIIRWVKERIGKFKIERGRIVPEQRRIRRRKKSKTNYLPKDNWSAIFIEPYGRRFYDGYIALLVGAEYVGDYPNGNYNILEEPRIKLDDLNVVLNYVNKQFPDGWRVNGKEVIAGKPDPIRLPERKIPEWERKAKERKKEEESKNYQKPFSKPKGIREALIVKEEKPRQIKRRKSFRKIRRRK